MMVTALGGAWIVEQPAQSRFEIFPRFRALYQKLKVYKVAWYMLHYGSRTPKRHFAYSNSPAVAKFSRGQLRGWRKLASGNVVKHYVDGKGKKRFVGTKLLKGTGFFP